MKTILSSNGHQIKIDESDYDRVSRYSWYVGRRQSGYIGWVKRSTEKNGKNLTIYLHREVLGLYQTETSLHVDHINGDPLDNRKENLRLVTPRQNSLNSKKRAGTSSKHKGVFLDKRRQRWFAHIMVNRKKRFLGYFKSEEQAAIAYNEAAKNEFGEFARLNVVPPVAL